MMATTKKDVPLPVNVENEEPLPVQVVESPKPKPHTVTSGEGIVLSPTTTEAQDDVARGQRTTAWLWERTQAITAVTVTTIAVLTLAWLSVTPNEPTQGQLVAALQLNVMATLILANYFARTNHTKGGSGGSSDDEYRGR